MKIRGNVEADDLPGRSLPQLTSFYFQHKLQVPLLLRKHLDIVKLYNS